MSGKICSGCELPKEFSEFFKQGDTKDGYRSRCKVCVKQQSRTEKFVTSQMYSSQKLSSKKRVHVPPNYTLEEFRAWCYDNTNWKELYLKWVESDYEQDLKPSADRLEDDLPYSFDNIQLVTWVENYDNGTISRSKQVLMIGASGNPIAVYSSVADAERKTGFKHIGDVCRGIRNHAGGCVFQFKKEE